MAGKSPDSPTERIEANTPASPWVSVGALKVGNGIYGGTLVSPRHVLTAAHVVAAFAANPSEISFQLNAGGSSNTIVAAEHVDIISSYSFPYDDLAIVRLASPVTNVVPSPIQDDVIAIGSTLSFVGYGASGYGDTGVTVGGNASIKRWGENTLDQIVSQIDASGRTSYFFLYDFDGPVGNGASGGPTLGNTRETMVVSGDSGSPVFVSCGGQLAVAGINTFASTLNSGRPLDYKFGQGGGGILLSDPRFVNWLIDKSNGTIKLVSTKYDK